MFVVQFMEKFDLLGCLYRVFNQISSLYNDSSTNQLKFRIYCEFRKLMLSITAYRSGNLYLLSNPKNIETLLKLLYLMHPTHSDCTIDELEALEYVSDCDKISTAQMAHILFYNLQCCVILDKFLTIEINIGKKISCV